MLIRNSFVDTYAAIQNGCSPERAKDDYEASPHFGDDGSCADPYSSDQVPSHSPSSSPNPLIAVALPVVVSLDEYAESGVPRSIFNNLDVPGEASAVELQSSIFVGVDVKTDGHDDMQRKQLSSPSRRSRSKSSTTSTRRATISLNSPQEDQPGSPSTPSRRSKSADSKSNDKEQDKQKSTTRISTSSRRSRVSISTANKDTDESIETRRISIGSRKSRSSISTASCASREELTDSSLSPKSLRSSNTSTGNGLKIEDSVDSGIPGSPQHSFLPTSRQSFASSLSGTSQLDFFEDGMSDVLTPRILSPLEVQDPDESPDSPVLRHPPLQETFRSTQAYHEQHEGTEVFPVDRSVTGFFQSLTSGISDAFDSPSNAVILFDWDDTLCPTHWGANQLKAGMLDFEALKHYSVIVAECLKAARRVGRVAIVTLASSGWFKESWSRYLPGLDQDNFLKDLGVRVCYALKPPSNCRANDLNLRLRTESKKLAMAKCLGQLYPPFSSRNVRWNVLSIGDSTIEQKALKQLLALNSKGALCKTIKFTTEPSLEELASQLEAIAPQLAYIMALNKDFDRKYSRY